MGIDTQPSKPQRRGSGSTSGSSVVSFATTISSRPDIGYAERDAEVNAIMTSTDLYSDSDEESISESYEDALGKLTMKIDDIASSSLHNSTPNMDLSSLCGVEDFLKKQSLILPRKMSVARASSLSELKKTPGFPKMKKKPTRSNSAPINPRKDPLLSLPTITEFKAESFDAQEELRHSRSMEEMMSFGLRKAEGQKQAHKHRNCTFDTQQASFGSPIPAPPPIEWYDSPRGVQDLAVDRFLCHSPLKASQVEPPRKPVRSPEASSCTRKALSGALRLSNGGENEHVV